MTGVLAFITVNTGGCRLMLFYFTHFFFRTETVIVSSLLEIALGNLAMRRTRLPPLSEGYTWVQGVVMNGLGKLVEIVQRGHESGSGIIVVFLMLGRW